MIECRIVAFIKSFRDLLIWSKAHKVAIEVAKLVRNLPNDRVANILASQIIRSATSTPANIAEGFGRYKGKEFARFLQIGLGSANETGYWLIYLKEMYPDRSQSIDNLASLNNESIKLLSITLRKVSS